MSDAGMNDARHNRLFQALMLAAVASNLYYLSYRISYTINFNALTFSLLFLAAEVHGVISLFLYFFDLWAPKFSHGAPPRMSRPTVDVYIPTYNEDPELLHRTVLAARDMRYPHQTYILDDGNRPEVRALAERLGVHYLARPEHSHAKAGNINHALAQTTGELIAIFDADHVPSPEFLERTLGYFEDEQVGFVQTPHLFYNVGSFQTFADYRQRRYWDDQLLFFRAVQPGKHHWGAAFFCGSCGVIRRRCLDEIGGFDSRTITEDLHTSLRIQSNGWKSAYHDEHLATGLSPGDLGAYWKQRMRWAVGNLSTLWHDNPLLKKKMTLAQRISYFSSVWAWTVGPQKLIYYLAAPVMLLTGFYPIENFSWTFLAIYAGNLAFSLCVFKAVSRGYGQIIRGELFSMINAFMLTFAMVRAMFGLGARKFIVTRKGGRSEHVLTYVLPQLLLVLFTLWCGTWAFLRFKYNMFLDATLMMVAAFWSAYNAALALLAIRVAVTRVDQRRQFRFRQRLPLRYEVVLADRRVTTGLGTTLDFHNQALAFRAFRKLPVGADVRLTVYLPDGERLQCAGRLPLRYWRNAEAARPDAPARDAWEYVVEITALAPEEAERMDRFFTRFAIPATFHFLTRVAPLRRRLGGVFLPYAVRRRFPRRGVQLPIAFRPAAVEGDGAWCVTDDLSEGGLCVLLREPGRRGQEVPFTLLAPGGPICGKARFVREEPVRFAGADYYRYGLQYDGLTPEELERIGRLGRYAIEEEVEA